MSFTLIVERVGCGPHDLDEVTNGNPIPPQPLYEGAVCLRELPSCAPSQCVGCEAIGCDEEPICDADQPE